MRTPALLSLCFVLTATACADGSGPDLSNTINLGVVIDRTGNNSEPSWVDAIKLARRHANLGLRRAGDERLQFGLLITDSGNEPTVATPRSLDLALAQGVKALILDTSQNDIAVNRTYYDTDPSNDMNVPIICGSCTSGSINNPAAVDVDPITQATYRNDKKWNWRCVMSTKLISQVLVRLMLENNNGDSNRDGVFKVSFYGSDEAFGRGAAKDLRAYMTSLYGANAILEEIYHPRDADANSYAWSQDMQKLTDNQNVTNNNVTDGVPDVIAVANFASQQAATIKAHKQGSYPIRMLHYHAMRFTTVLQSLGSLANGAEGVSHVLVDPELGGQTFADEFLQLYGVGPVYRDSNYYDSAVVLMLATMIASAGLEDPTMVTGAQIRDALPRTSDPTGTRVFTGPDEFAKAVELIAAGQPINYEGASGPMDFDAYGNIINRLARFRAESGAFVDITRYDCVQEANCPVDP